jgi:hypothetical protein
MIIILEPQKDTYVTNLKTQNNDASLSNVGHAATLDLFKLYNENKHAKSWAVFDINSIGLIDGDVIKLQDVDGNTITFFVDVTKTSNADGAGGIQFGASEDTKGITAGSFVEGIQYEITATNDGIGGANTDFKLIGASNNDIGTKFIATGIGIGTGTAIIKNAIIIGVNTHAAATHDMLLKQIINAVTSFNNDLTLNMTAYNNSNNQLILKQNKSGDSGDTNIVFDMTNTTLKNEYTDADNNTVRKFARIDYSALLIKFDLAKFKQDWNIGNSLAGSFITLKAELVLKDVTTGIAKPKDYGLEVYSLEKSFDEGIGKDTIHFSDKDNSNFTSLDSSNNWEVAEYVSSPDAIELSAPAAIISDETSKGDEDLSFDITNYVSAQLESHSDKGFLVKFPDSILYDQKSYFVKRLGSRHLINKQFVPQLRIKIDDSTYNIPTNSFNKVRYLDNAEDFYLFNRVNGKLQNFKEPSGFNVDTHLKMKISSRDNTVDFITITANNHANSPITNFKGDSLNGVRKSSLNNTQLSRYNSAISSKIKNNKLSATITWFWHDGTDTYNITTENIEFEVSETRNESKYENLITSIRVTENDLFANDGTNSVEVYFVDTKKEFTAVKVPYELPSENLGDVYYQVYDVETGKLLIDYDDASGNSATKMFYDGEKYKFNLFVPKLFKNLRINFKFKYKDPITNVDKFIFNDKYSVRVV